MKQIFSLAVITLLVPFAFAGTESSGGGPSVFCPTSTLPEEVAQLYDFFEGRLREGLNIPVTNSATKEEQAEWRLKKLEALDPIVAMDVREKYERVRKNISYLPDGILMTSVNDLGTGQAPIVPMGCQLAYAGYFESTGTLRVARLIFDRLKETEKAALLLHEALYLVAREMTHQKDSRSARIVNAYLFSTETEPSPLVKEALETMRLAGGSGPIIAVQTRADKNSLLLRSTCVSPSLDRDKFFWAANATLWGPGSIYYPDGTAPYNRSERVSLMIGAVFPAPEYSITLMETTRTITFQDTESNRKGGCEKANVELIYEGKVVAEIPAKLPAFTVRLFPVQ